LFASYVNNVGIQKDDLLALAPLINKEEPVTRQHVEFIEATLALSNVLLLITNNCNTNKKISKELGNLLFRMGKRLGSEQMD
jgi:hypothetical protein